MDAFIVSDSLAGQYRRGEFWRDGAKVPFVKAVQGMAEDALRASPEFEGMRKLDKNGRPDRLTFRIYTTAEYERKVKPGGCRTL